MLSLNKLENIIGEENFSKDILRTKLSEYINNLSQNTLLANIGNTPLIRLGFLKEKIPLDVDILAKIEWMNPGGSVKDRPAWNIIKSALLSGELFIGSDSFRTMVDASSGNTAIGYALVASTLGLKLKLFIPQNASKERIQILKAYGVEIVLTDPLEGIDGSIEAVRKYVETHPDVYYLDQYNNDANWKAHYYGTANEVLNQTRNSLTHFVCCLGTTGTFMGIGQRIKEILPNSNIVAVQPDSPFHGIEGVKHLASSIVPGIYDKNLPDQTLFVSSQEAQDGTKLLAQNGLFGGTSSGAALAACLKIAETLDYGTIVTIFPDKGDRYISTNTW